MNGHGVRGNWRNSGGQRSTPRGRRGGGGNRNFRRGGKPISN